MKNKKTGAEYRTRELLLDSLIVLPPTPQRHELAKTIHATFLYPTARLPHEGKAHGHGRLQHRRG